MLRAIVIILLIVMVTGCNHQHLDAKWEMSQFAILLGWASHGDHPTDEGKMEAIAKAGFNSVMWYDPNILDLAHKYGLKALVQIKPPHLISGLPKFREHPANWGYYIGDEPAPAEYPGMTSEVEATHQADPSHPAYVNCHGAHPTAPFLAAVPVKLLSYTGTYQWLWYNTPHYKKMEAFRIAGLAAGIPVIRWIYVTANPDVETWQLKNMRSENRKPDWSVHPPPPSDNAEKLRQSVYGSLCYGVKGIQWFTGAILFKYGTSNLNDCGKDVATLNWELQKLGPTLMGLESVEVFHTPPLPRIAEDAAAVRQLPVDYWVRTDTPDLILGIFKDKQGNDYIMAANRKIDSTREAVLSFPQDVTKVAKFGRGEGEWTDLPLTKRGNRAVVELTLAPGDGELLRVQTANVYITKPRPDPRLLKWRAEFEKHKRNAAELAPDQTE
jgi:hypothetical protein